MIIIKYKFYPGGNNMLNERYEKLEKVNEKACELLGYMKGSLECLDELDKDNPLNFSKEEAKDMVISALRKQLKELEDVIYNR